MRLLRVVLALVFGLAMALPQAPSCTHHEDAHPSGHHHDAQTSPPQACCPAAITASLHTPVPRWTIAPAPRRVADAPLITPLVLPARARALPFALAPPASLV
jgi:hypothetical protein